MPSEAWVLPAMASSLASTASSAISTKAATNLSLSSYRYSSSNVSFRFSPRRIVVKGSPPGRMLCPMVKAQLNEVAVDGPSNAMASGKAKSEVAAAGTEDAEPSNLQSSGVLATEESISEFVTQVASLVKLVDSRDVVELQLKQLDCEITIRKKEAMPQPPTPLQATTIQFPLSPVTPPFTPLSTVTPAPASLAPTLSTSPVVKSGKSSHPPLKSPMAGTFYRSPAPGEPPFVKVGDKVKKGQVLCIIEAMKLMNEIEADLSGTIVDILLDDGKPVSVDTPLFVIEP